MKVFISWARSGSRSEQLARAIRDWVPLMVHTVQPWLSGEDIAPGERWSQVLGQELDQTSFGILCITPETLDSGWMLFEAGALGKSMARSRVVPLLLEVPRTALPAPLAQFQAVEADRAGMEHVIESLHAATGTSIQPTQLAELFNDLWPRFEKRLSVIRGAGSIKVPKQTDSELLREIHAAVRTLRIRPDEESIVAALGELRSELEARLAYAEKEDEYLTATDAPISLQDRAIATMSAQLKRIHTAITALRSLPDTQSAAAVSVLWLSDLREAIDRLREDLEVREYRMELHGDFSSAAYANLQAELEVVKRLQAFSHESKVS